MSRVYAIAIFAVVLLGAAAMQQTNAQGVLQPATVVPELPEAIDVDPHPWWIIDRSIQLADGSEVHVVSGNSAALAGRTSDPSITPGEACGPNNAGTCTAQARWCHGFKKPNAVPNICRAGAFCCLAVLPPAPRFAQVSAEAEAEAEAGAEAETAVEAEALPAPGQRCGTGSVGICSGRANWCGAGAAAGKPVAKNGICAGAAVCCMPTVVPATPVTPARPATPAVVPTPTPRPATPVAPTPARPVTPTPARPVTPTPAPAASGNGWWSGASRVAGVSGSRFAASTVPYKIVLHTTEGPTSASAVTAYKQHKSWPHFTVSFEGNVFSAKQHIPITHAARALLHPRGSCDTNNAHAIQIEITGFCQNASNFARGYLDGIGSLLAWIQSQVNVRAVAPPTNLWIPHPRSYGSKARQRMTCAAWTAFNGVCGHQHVPYNKHGDPGTIDITYLLSKMKP